MGRQIETCAKPVPGCGVATPSKNGMPCQLSITTTTTTTDQQQQCSNNAWCTMSANTAHNNVATTYSAQQVPTTTQWQQVQTTMHNDIRTTHDNVGRWQVVGEGRGWQSRQSTMMTTMRRLPTPAPILSLPLPTLPPASLPSLFPPLPSYVKFYLVIYIIIYSVNLILLLLSLSKSTGNPPQVQVQVYPGDEMADPWANPYLPHGYG